MAQRNKLRYWIAFIAAAVLIHVVLLFTVKPSFFSLFKKSIATDVPGSPQRFSGADVIVTIPVEIEDEVSEKPVPEQTEEVNKNEDSKSDALDDPAFLLENLGDLVGEGPVTIDRDPGPRPVVVPPKPVEITWPDTRSLRTCIGMHIIISIQVGEKGEILQVRPEEKDLPMKCIQAALVAAEKIIFVPGRINGVAAKMWTRVRMDFRQEID